MKRELDIFFFLIRFHCVSRKARKKHEGMIKMLFPVSWEKGEEALRTVKEIREVRKGFVLFVSHWVLIIVLCLYPLTIHTDIACTLIIFHPTLTSLIPFLLNYSYQIPLTFMFFFPPKKDTLAILNYQ